MPTWWDLLLILQFLAFAGILVTGTGTGVILLMGLLEPALPAEGESEVPQVMFERTIAAHGAEETKRRFEAGRLRAELTLAEGRKAQIPPSPISPSTIIKTAISLYGGETEDPFLVGFCSRLREALLKGEV